MLNNKNNTPAKSESAFEYADIVSTSVLFKVHQQKFPLFGESKSTFHASLVFFIRGPKESSPLDASGSKLNNLLKLNSII